MGEPGWLYMVPEKNAREIEASQRGLAAAVPDPSQYEYVMTDERAPGVWAHIFRLKTDHWQRVLVPATPRWHPTHDD